MKANPANLLIRKIQPDWMAPLCLSFMLALSSVTAIAQEAMWTPNFRNSDILEVIRAVQDVTGKTMILDPRVRGEITVISSSPVNAQDYYRIFLRALDITGFTAVETGDNMVSIVPSQEVRSAPLPFSSYDSNDSSRYVTEAIQLDNVSVNQVLPVLRPLVSQSNGQMSAYPDGNMIILVDTVANVQRIRQILDRIDQSSVPETEVVSLQFAQASDIVALLREMNEDQVAADQEPVTSRLQINADTRTNSVLVTGGKRQRDTIRELITLLDKPREQTGNTRVVYLEYASAERVAEVLTSVIRNTFQLGGAAPGQGVTEGAAADGAR
ncbi:MAG TPA: type II secretion system protein GspD, partial [Pseudohongiella sp.]|nr:type II secretion system protein GspD [Pseudohongiella sp.]